MSEMLDYALEYAKKGLAVFPLKPRDKAPRIANGFYKATTDEAQIETWWKMWPDSNIGIATGQISGGICVLDLDVDEEKGINGIRTLRDWEYSHGNFPPSWTVKTGRGGWHYYFKSNEEIKNRIKMLPGIDVRGDGGYVVAPPSVHQNGKKYEWFPNLSPDVIPIITMESNIKYLLHHQDVGTTKPVYVAPDKIPEGERNGMLFKFACMMQAKGASDQTIYAATSAENESKCNPPLTDWEIQQIVNSALKYEKGKPIYVQSDMTAIQGQRAPIFQLTDKGKIKKSWENIREAIEFDEELYSHIRFNELANSPWVYGKLPWNSDEDTYRAWTDADDNSLKAYLEKRYGFSDSTKIMDALSIVLAKNKFNPVKEELIQIHNQYKDDCDGSIKKLLPEYTGAENSEYTYEVLKLFMLGAICRVFTPGCKFDYTLILHGGQGWGKSEFIRHLALAPEWFNDNFNTFEGDKASEKLSGMWMVELAELKALKSAKDSETIKAFLTSRYDTYRAPYARRSTQRPRMCVFAGTTNNMNVFVDKTGNRRFLPIITNKPRSTKDLFSYENVDEDFRRAWAEAMKLYYEADGQPQLILPKAINDIAEQMQEEFSEEDYRVGVIQNWLDVTDASKICVPLIIEYALNLEPAKTTKAHQREILEILDNEIQGWSRINNKDKGRTSFTRYGKQVGFIRDFE